MPERFYSHNGTTKNKLLWLPFGTFFFFFSFFLYTTHVWVKYYRFSTGSGPRICIGERFAMMQMKVAIVSLLKSFRLEFTTETPKTIELETSSVLLHSDQSINLKFVADAK